MAKKLLVIYADWNSLIFLINLSQETRNENACSVTARLKFCVIHSPSLHLFKRYFLVYNDQQLRTTSDFTYYYEKSLQF